MSQEDLTYSILTIAFLFIALIFVAKFFAKFKRTRYDLIKNGNRTYNLFILAFGAVVISLCVTVFDVALMVAGF